VIDLALSLALIAAALAATIAYGERVRRRGAARNARVDSAGSSVLLGKGAMEGTYWLLEPIGAFLARRGVTANAITVAALASSIAGAAAIALGHFGVAALLALVAALGDALDGVVARRSGTASEAGEVLDAAVDRYEEFFFLGALAYCFRGAPIPFMLSLLALLGSFMVSYGSAKAEALHVKAPRGAMRRAERALYLVLGLVLAPIAAALAARLGLPPWVGSLPIVIALALVGVVANVSAARRLAAIARAVRQRGAAARRDDAVRSTP
jgi:CDP-diacylglycerol---glycerol-3-phosphate 3-phosphatidyltransferase